MLEPEIYNPHTDAWSLMAPMATPRQYHSAAVLLADGSVFVAGGQMFQYHPSEQNLEAEQRSYQIFKPPYFFNLTRPTIDDCPDVVEYNEGFDVSYTSTIGDITKVRLIRPGAATHSYDQNQRMLELDFTEIEPGVIRVAAPPDGNHAPPGYYLLFLASGTNGKTPSEGRFIRLRHTNSYQPIDPDPV